jgi:phosphinothricin acetyltransferase
LTSASTNISLLGIFLTNIFLLFIFDFSKTKMINIRTATEADQQDIMDIYNDAITNTTATFDTEPRTLEKQMQWFRTHKINHPVIVAEENNLIIGWASLSHWSDRCAYDTTVEVSVYVDKNFQAKGIGSRLLEKVTQFGKELGNHTVLSRIAGDNAASIHIHEKFGYKTIGVMKEVGFKFGKFIDVTMMQLVYESN